MTRTRFLTAAALAAVTVGGVVPAASADPAPEIPRGMPRIVEDVLRPGDAGFWNPAVRGTRILTPLPERARVACSAGFEPPISCSYLDGERPQRFLEHVDVPTLGGAPLRLWVDVPRWGDGSTGQVNRLILGA